MNVYQAYFEDVDCPDKINYTLTFHSKKKAVEKLTEWAKRHDITHILWEDDGNDGQYFNHQFLNHHSQDNACYHGNITKVTVK